MKNLENQIYLNLFKTLPHLNGNKEIVNDWGYTPSLYHFDGQWCVSWVHCEEGDVLLNYEGSTPEEAILNAYNNYKKEIKVMNECCSDNRFEIIAKAKQALLEETNIETSEDEMKVIDNFLFRCWQMGWLKKYDAK